MLLQKYVVLSGRKSFHFCDYILLEVDPSQRWPELFEIQEAYILLWWVVKSLGTVENERSMGSFESSLL